MASGTNKKRFHGVFLLFITYLTASNTFYFYLPLIIMSKNSLT